MTFPLDFVGTLKARRNDAPNETLATPLSTSARLQGAPDPDALAIVNRAAQAAPVQVQLNGGSRVATATASQALSSVARDAFDIVGDPQARRRGVSGASARSGS